MAYDYALVHLKFTIPLALLLTAVLKPLLTRVDLYKTTALIVIAFTAALPWDSYLVHLRIWTYPPEAIIGPRLFLVPAEELFFFVIQTYITSMVYILVNKATFHPQYLTTRAFASRGQRYAHLAVQLALAACIGFGFYLTFRGGQGTYLGLILAWAGPFALLTWTFSGLFIVNMPTSSVAIPVLFPTLYLWLVDELALGRGTWAIETGTKYGITLWGSLDVEEAIFFLATNVLIVFGLVAFDRGMAVVNSFPELFPEVPAWPSVPLILRGVFTSRDKYDMSRVLALREAVQRLRRKSRSFYLASAVFPGRLRIDLVLLYSFCRVADDLVDEAKTEAEALDWIARLMGYLNLAYSENSGATLTRELDDYIDANFPKSTRSELRLLPIDKLPSGPLYELLDGFKMDLGFTSVSGGVKTPVFPIVDEAALQLYAHRVASTVGELCLWLVFHHGSTKLTKQQESALVQAAQTMGHALQYVNIARDIKVDADIDRVYLPANWLKEEGLTPQDVIQDPDQPRVERLRTRLLDLAFEEYRRSRTDMNMLPGDIRGPLVVAVESYMEIGRVLRERKGAPSPKDPRRATVPRSRRIWVAWKNLSAE